MSLFRPEALRSRQQDWLGVIHLSQPVALRWISAGAGLALLGLAALLWGVSAPRQVHLNGVLLPDRGLVRVMPAQPGSLAQVLVQEGQSVQAGQPMFSLQLDALRPDASTRNGLQQSLEDRRRSLSLSVDQAAVWRQARLAALAQRVAALRGERDQLDRQAALQQQRLDLVDAALARLESLRGDHFVSPAQVQAKQEESLGLRADALAIARQRQALERELAAAEAERLELPLAAAQRQAELQRQGAELDEQLLRAGESASRQELVVRAPVAGRVVTLHAAAGEHVSAQGALATLVPEGARLQAHLYAPSSALGFVEAGQAVSLRLQAFPYQRFGLQAGRVLHVAQAPVQGPEQAALPMTRGLRPDEPLYRITVEMAEQSVQAQGRRHPLLSGMQLEADVSLERRRLAEWLFDGLLGRGGRG